MVDDTDEGSKSSNDLKKVDDDTKNLESTGSGNVECDNNYARQDDRMGLPSREKYKGGMIGVKRLDTVEN